MQSGLVGKKVMTSSAVLLRTPKAKMPSPQFKLDVFLMFAGPAGFKLLTPFKIVRMNA